ncbi:MAG TPA: HEAT repeat domain-containing protein [Nitrospirae bacterium]|nr:HEAT repeat domain-containing protein [Nitrospirota bacterium]
MYKCKNRGGCYGQRTTYRNMMENKQDTASMLKMIADYMENGFLDNIVDMFKHDKSLYPLIGDLIGDERSRVRIGTVALVETLKSEDGNNVTSAIAGIAEFLKTPNATIRGDAAYLLGIIGHRDALPFLKNNTNDENELVRETVEEAIEEIKEGDSGV